MNNTIEDTVITPAVELINNDSLPVRVENNTFSNNDTHIQCTGEGDCATYTPSVLNNTFN